MAAWQRARNIDALPGLTFWVRLGPPLAGEVPPVEIDDALAEWRSAGEVQHQ